MAISLFLLMLGDMFFIIIVFIIASVQQTSPSVVH